MGSVKVQWKVYDITQQNSFAWGNGYGKAATLTRLVAKPQGRSDLSAGSQGINRK